MKNRPLFSMASIHKLFSNIFGFRVVQTGRYVVTATATVSTASGSTLDSAAAHGARANDSIVFLTGAYEGDEFDIKSVPDSDSLILGYSFPEGMEPAPGDTFRVTRAVTAAYDSTGALTVSAIVTPTPILYTRDSLDQEVTEDTVTPSNNRGLPVKVISDSGIVQKQNLTITDKVYHKIVTATPATHIPASGAASNLELFAATSSQALKLDWQDDIGEYIGVYTGAGLGTLVAIIGRGGTSKEITIPSGTRVSVRAMENVAISTDGVALALHLLG